MSDSSNNVESFFELCSQDQALRQQIKTLNDEQIVSLANSKGLAFTIEDLESVLSPGGDSEELSDKDLELVAGGARALNAVSDGLVCNTIRSLFSTESGCGGGFKFKGRKKTI